MVTKNKSLKSNTDVDKQFSEQISDKVENNSGTRTWITIDIHLVIINRYHHVYTFVLCFIFFISLLSHILLDRDECNHIYIVFIK